MIIMVVGDYGSGNGIGMAIVRAVVMVRVMIMEW